MPLRVAPCPRCRQPIAYGERKCRNCAQVFDYGPGGPPEPTWRQVEEALRAAAMPQAAQPAQAHPQAQPSAQAPARTPRRYIPEPSADAEPEEEAHDTEEGPRPLLGIDRGRFEPTGDVRSHDLPGLIDSELFRASTNVPVAAPLIPGLDAGRFEPAPEVRVALIPGLETSEPAKDAFAVPMISGVFHSDIYKTTAEVPVARIDGVEPSPSAMRPRASAGKGKGAKRPLRDDELSRIVCRCGELHRLPLCPQCGLVHRERG
jgi:hypothetical protein